MTKKIKIAWDVSHLEFTIEDHYYFSILKSSIKDAGGVVKEVDSLKDIKGYDVVVLNYPEKPFTKGEAALLKQNLQKGKKVIVCGYYNNEDKIADTINSLSSNFGFFLRSDKVMDKSSNENSDDLLVVTSRVLSYNDSVKRVLFPCSASVKMNTGLARPIVLLENPPGSKNSAVIGAETQVG